MDNQAIRERYFASPDPLLHYGLPTSRVEDMGNHYAIRTQAGGVTAVEGRRALGEGRRGDRLPMRGYIAKQVGRTM